MLPVNSQHFSRRQFLATTGGATASFLLARHLGAAESDAPNSAVLRGFIISDSHFGWKDPQQPSVEVQRAALAHVAERFSDLDVIIDSGDAHHNYATAEDRGHWTDVVVKGSGPRPFYYLAGNHDVTAWSYDWDPEEDSVRLGSNSCRPYYSFDLKGIHFLAIPELMNVCSVTEEVLAWARLDLALNRDKTIVVISHNSLLGTTEPRSDNAYRVIVNSDDVYRLLDSAPNVVAWMHGHNHDYVIVPKDNRLYVSNGRFGGFAPKDSKAAASNALGAPLGGIYFELHPDKFVVRGYSIADRKFLDEMPGGENLSHTLRRPTSLDPVAKPHYSYGVGAMAPGTKIPAYAYHAGGPAKLFLQAAAAAAINQNPDFTQYTVRRSGKAVDRMLIGYTVNPTDADLGFKWNNPGITILPAAGHDEVVLGAPGNARGRRGYYKVAPGSTLQARVVFGAVTPGVEITPVLRLATNNTNNHGEWTNPPLTLAADTKTVETAFTLPADKLGIYAQDTSDLLQSVWIDFVFRRLTGSVELKSLHLTVSAPAADQARPALVVNGSSYGVDPEQAADIFEIPLAARNTDRAVVEAVSTRPVTWLIQEEPAWQSRNAPLVASGSSLQINRRTNDFGPEKDILLAPLTPLTTPYVHRLSGICPAKVDLYDADTRRLRIEAQAIDGKGILEIITPQPPRETTGAEILQHANGRLLARVSAPGPVVFTF